MRSRCIRAFRAPSLINNSIQTSIINQLNLGLINPLLSGQIYNFPITAVGNPDMKQETMTAYELGYTGVVRRRATLRHTSIDSAAFTPGDGC